MENGIELSEGELNEKAIQFSGLESLGGTPGDMNGDGSWEVLDVVALANCVLVDNCDGLG